MKTANIQKTITSAAILPMNTEQEAWRIFIAIPIPQPIQAELAKWCREQRNVLHFQKWVHDADYHITLQFLGDTDVQKIKEIAQSLEKSVKGFEPFELRLAGIGTFGRKEQPRVLWAGVQGELDRLHALHSSVTSAMSPLGFIPEDRPYSPHVTLARKCAPEAVFHPLSASSSVFGSWQVQDIVIYRTKMGHKPMYEILETISLA
ncbi:RNA 2',3'-cyclic phosphodiesterase [Paenibacillus caui]|uniref:RNA 2',3'-cyclic phosphodiesterase n=1 Tax=Paenibacillus caui TaxID=2873927 RepID=UPI001F02AEAE|nr:RNA 2',3'-cyclic phosphodiesterase [Paenibacillus caui]